MAGCFWPNVSMVCSLRILVLPREFVLLDALKLHKLVSVLISVEATAPRTKHYAIFVVVL